MVRIDIPASIEWRCVSCGDDGVISGWERSPYDLRPVASEARPGEVLRAVIAPEVAATLRILILVDSHCERLILAASVSDGRIELQGISMISTS